MSAARVLEPGTVAGLPVGGAGFHLGSGYDWIERVRRPWRVLSAWGAEGWDLGEWPLVIGAVCPPREGQWGWRFAWYVEGDVTAWEFEGYGAFLDVVTAHAVEHWRMVGEGPQVPPGPPWPDHVRVPWGGHPDGMQP